ncbi:MAG: hypothetical protein AAFV80_02600 [Bacteroidota bacterium]
MKLNASKSSFLLPTYPGFDFQEALRFLQRSDKESTHVSVGQGVRKMFLFEERSYLLECTQPNTGHLHVHSLNDSLSGDAARYLESQCIAWLGTVQDPTSFYAALSGDAILGPLIQRFRGLPLVGIPDFLETISWAIIGQQINLAFAYTCKQRLVEHYGTRLEFEGQDFYAFPSAAAIAGADPAILRKYQFSRQKINYLIGIAQALDRNANSGNDCLHGLSKS